MNYCDNFCLKKFILNKNGLLKCKLKIYYFLNISVIGVVIKL